MSDENLGDVLDESYRKHKRDVALKNLGTRTHLTLEKLAKLVAHKDHGATVKDITLQELIDVGRDGVAAAPAPAAAPPAATPTPAAAKKTTKKVAAKKSGTPTKAAAPAAKKATKKAAAKKVPDKKGPKADKGKPKPRLDYEVGKREVLAAIKAADGPVGRGDIEKATGYTGVQVRTFAKSLKAEGKIQVLGEGGRSTKYAPPEK